MKRILAIIVSAFLLAGCAGTPQQQNAGLGALGGAALGALYGNRTDAAAGAIVGALVGSFIPTPQPRPAYAQGYPAPAYNSGYGMTPNCTRLLDGARTFARSEAECAHFSRGPVTIGPQPAMVQQGDFYGGYPQVTSEGHQVYQQDPRTCPRVPLGGGRWRCQ